MSPERHKKFGFNSATAFQPWKPDGLHVRGVMMRWLQFGHGFSAVETLLAVLPTLHTIAASIRPRLFSRGNVAAGLVFLSVYHRFNSATAFQPWKLEDDLLLVR